MMKQLFNQRRFLCVMMFCGLITNYMLRVNISMAIIKMVHRENSNTSQSICVETNTTEEGGDDGGDDNKGTKLDWTGDEVSIVLLSFFIGYAAFQVPGGRLAEIYGTKKVFGYSMAVAVLAVITPVLAPVSVWLIVTVRILQGLLEAVSFPALNPMVSKWVPDKEKSAFVSFAYVGGTVGSIITNPLCGVIIQKLGWEAVFYITAGVTMVWFLAWILLVTDMPEDNKYISEEEKEFIIATRTFDHTKTNEDDVPLIPLLFDMLRCPPMLALMMCDFANAWGLFVLVTEGPIFFWEVLGFNIKEVGFLSSLPYLGRFVGAQVVGIISNQVTKNEMVAPLTLQKINTCTEFLFPAAGMVLLSYMTDNAGLCVAILSIAFGFNGAIYAGHYTNGLTIAPNRSGTVMGLSNGFGSIAGIFVPMVKENLVGSPATCSDLIHRWRIMFAIPAGIYVVVAIIFLIFASGEVQNFDKKEYKKKYCFLI